MTSVDIVQSFNSGIGPDLQSPYSEVHVLLIAGAKNDLLGVEKEIEDLRQVFENDYKYSVAFFPIPDDGGHRQRLNTEICCFVEDKSRHGSLIVVYYAGHCSPDAHDQAEWAAFEEGGPTLSREAQRSHCCHVSLITRGTKNEGSRFELIAASAKGVKTPIPGPKSFTTALIKLLKQHAEEGISSESLSSKLREHGKIMETPVFHDFVRKSPTNIRLQRLAYQDGFMQKPTGYLLLRASLSGNVTGMQIAQWLKSAPPTNVTAVSIEAIVSRACQIQGLHKDGVFTEDSVLSELSKPARDEIKRCLRGLNTVMAVTAEYAKDAAATTADHAEADTIRDSLGQIEESVSTFCTAVEAPLLLEKGVGIVSTLTTDAIDDGELPSLRAAANVDAALLLRDAILNKDPCHYSIEIARQKIAFKSAEQHVIVETYKYKEAPDHSGEPQQQRLRQVRRVTGLLCHPKRKGFHILPCVGFFRNRRSQELGLVFNLPLNCDLSDGGGVVTLIELHRLHRLVPLGQRIHLAWALATAVEHFHRVGWVHKSIRSNNIAFTAVPKMPLAQDSSKVKDGDENPNPSFVGNFEVGEPLLFGFGDSRAGDEDYLEEDHLQTNNLYRIPERWGRPSARFEKSHLVYSLGVVLLEIAFWKGVDSVLEKYLDKGRVVSAEVADTLREKCIKSPPHQVGGVFARCIMTCLDFGARTKSMSEYEAQRYFQRNVTELLGRVVQKV